GPRAPRACRRPARASSPDELEAARGVAGLPAELRDRVAEPVGLGEVLRGACGLALLGELDDLGRRLLALGERGEAEDLEPGLDVGGERAAPPPVPEPQR